MRQGPWLSRVSSCEPWGSSSAREFLSRRLRTLVYDGSSPLPSFLEAVNAARAELELTPTLGVLFVRIDYVGFAAELFSAEDIAAMYSTIAKAARALIGVHLRKVDLPADLGLAEEGFAILLSRPRDQEALTAADVAGVAARYAREIWRVFREVLPTELSRRVLVHVGGGLVRRPSEQETIVEALVSGLGDAYEDAIAKQNTHLQQLAASVKSGIESGRLDVTYQPVVTLEEGRVVGFHAGLASAAEAPLGAEDALFDVARRAGFAEAAYRAYHRSAVAGAEGAMNGDEWLLVWVGAAELISSAVVEMGQLFAERGRPGSGPGANTEAPAALSPANVVFLVDAMDLSGSLASSALGFRSAADMGFKLGLDVRTGGPPPLDYVRELNLDVIRLGGRVIAGLVDDPDMFEVASLLVRFARRHGITTVAAECATGPQLERARSLGVDCVQGSLIAPYGDAPSRSSVLPL